MEKEEGILYQVVINSEEQYSIWPTFKTIPEGWQAIGPSGDKELCLKYIKEVWKDLRPLSLRNKMAQDQTLWKASADQITTKSQAYKLSRSSVVDFLSQGSHPLTAKPTSKNCHELKESLDRQYVHLTFTDTKGMTTLGIKVSSQGTDLHSANFNQGTGSIHIEGSLILDYCRMNCTADIDLSTLEGTGRLEVVEELKPFLAFANSK